jgi:hypothetical protein
MALFSAALCCRKAAVLLCALPLKGSGCFPGHDSWQAVGHLSCQKGTVPYTLRTEFLHSFNGPAKLLQVL